MTSRLERNKQNRKNINKEEKKEKFKRRFSVFFKVFCIIFIIVALFTSTMYFIGNAGIVVKEYSLDYDNLPESFYGIKVIHISDINYGQKVNKNKLDKISKKINNIYPDIVVFTGNLIHPNKKLNKSDTETIIQFLNEIQASTGKYIIKGKNDNDNFEKIVSESSFQYLDNESTLIYYKGYTPIQLLGFNSKIDNNILNYRDDLFTLALVHEPDNINKILQNYNPSLVLSGCALNKQINIPYIKDLIKMDGALNYNEEYHKVNNSDLYISSGIGTLKYPFRLFNHPSFNLYRLK